MANHKFTPRLLLLLVLAGAIGFSCSKKAPTASTAPVVTHDTVPHITGRYSGYSMLENYDNNSHGTSYVTINVDSIGDTLNGCPRDFTLSLDNGFLSPQVISAAGFPWALAWDCSDSLFHYSLKAKADGKAVAGSLYQSRITTHGDSLFIIVTFSATRP